MEDMEQPEKKIVIHGKGIHNKWKWSTIIVSILSVIIISVLSYQLYSVSQNNPGNSTGTMQQGPGGDGAPSGTPPSLEPGQNPESSDDDSNTGTSDNDSSDSTSSENSI
ncbi:hypothetical protein ACP0AK_06735 [Listeria ivanovii]|uniref:Uncharacterized protein n=2 Tax=Listeria ivanovii TaxID=1638 RepID=G2ZB39_LISIP|nr:hypothetical protein [Listeria ivanovii]AHI54966.1 hypothetical protein AX25_02180 [Listeria ivanovii WSLC3009]AIS64422.1 hypothetical protein JL52_02135 [Listeria ivanovii subsp. ivanovii]MBC1758908.1 hypothetical protein [Listeria ivanovii]MBK3915248.1 hypothetical protein [Listeria ivanovii subsp. ivanovii]MBK3922375.1 hypothetical protein [Listeria ivanovii subsp. ivanovii]